MTERLNEFKQVLLNLNDLCSVEVGAWQSWVTSWTEYTFKGGTRPPQALPHL